MPATPDHSPQTLDDLADAVAALPPGWRRAAVAAFMDRARDLDRPPVAAFWHALALVLDDAERDERGAFAALADAHPDTFDGSIRFDGSKGEALADGEPIIPDGWDVADGDDR